MVDPARIGLNFRWSATKNRYEIGSPQLTDPIHHIDVQMTLTSDTLRCLQEHLKPQQGVVDEVEVMVLHRNRSYKECSSNKFKVGEGCAEVDVSVPIHCNTELLKRFLAVSTVQFRFLNARGRAFFEAKMPLDIFHAREISRGPRRLIVINFWPAAGGNRLCPVDVNIAIKSILLTNGSEELDVPLPKDIKSDISATSDITFQAGGTTTNFDSGPSPLSAPDDSSRGNTESCKISSDSSS